MPLVELKFISKSFELSEIYQWSGGVKRICAISNEVRQGGCLSPFLFNLSLWMASLRSLKIYSMSESYFVSDDIVLVCENLIDLEIAMILH